VCATKHPEIFQALAAPFDPREVKQRVGGGGRKLSYITARTAMNRLDEVLGPENWWDDYDVIGDVLYCRLTVRLPDGAIVTKLGAGGFKQMTEKQRDGTYVIDEENTDKTGESDALKRAAVKFGVARYLYQDGVPDYGDAPTVNVDSPPARDNGHDRREPPRYDNNNGNGDGGEIRMPSSGKGLWAWSKDLGQRHGVDVVGLVNGWGKQHDLPARMVDWPPDAVADAARHVLDRLASSNGNGGGNGAGGSQQPASQSVLRARLELSKKLWQLARSKYGKNADKNHVHRVLDELSKDVGEVIESISECQNEGLMQAYAVAAEADLAAIGGAA